MTKEPEQNDGLGGNFSEQKNISDDQKRPAGFLLIPLPRPCIHILRCCI